MADFTQSKIIRIDAENVELYSCIAYSVALKRLVKIVLARKQFSNKKLGEALLFTTDLELDMLQIYEFYVSRFQIEFIFRDAKGFTGLGVQYPFSMANWTRQYHVRIIAERFISMFGFGQTCIKSHPMYKSFLSFGNISHRASSKITAVF